MTLNRLNISSQYNYKGCVSYMKANRSFVTHMVMNAFIPATGIASTSIYNMYEMNKWQHKCRFAELALLIMHMN